MSSLLLSSQERDALKEIASEAMLTPGARRAQALLWLAEGKSIQEVVSRLGVCRQTVYNWVTSFRQRRHDSDIVACLNDKPRSGRPSCRPRMSTLPLPQILDSLIAAVIRRDPRECGYRSLLWTAKLLRQYLQDVHHMKVTIASVHSALARLETRWQPLTVLAGEPHTHNKVA